MTQRLVLTGAASVLVAIGLLPILMMVASTVYSGGGGFSLAAYQQLAASSEQLMPLMGHSTILSLAVTFIAIITGVPLGILLGRTDLPVRTPLTVLLTLPLLIPPYVFAVSWFSVLGPAGLSGHFFSPSISEFLTGKLFTPYGCVGVLSTAFLPVSMLVTIVYAGTVNPRLEQAALLTSRWPRVLWHITLPLIAPAIAFAAILVFLLTLGEIGVPTYLRYPVYPVEIMTQFAAFYDFRAATAAAVPLLVVTAMILLLEFCFLHGASPDLSAATLGERSILIKVGRWRQPLFTVVLAWTLMTIVLPMAMLVVQSTATNGFAEAFTRASDSLLRSIAFAAIGATLLTVLGFFCGYLIHHRALPVWREVDALALFLFTLPGTVIGIGLISLWNRPETNAIYATPAIIILGYLAQYIVLPTRMTAVVLQRVPPSFEQAARLCGASWFMTLRDVVVPWARRDLVAIWVIAYVFCLRDLGITMVIYPPGSDTLPVRILTLMANGAPSLIAALCVILIVITLLPLALVGLWQARSGRSS